MQFDAQITYFRLNGIESLPVKTIVIDVGVKIIRCFRWCRWGGAFFFVSPDEPFGKTGPFPKFSGVLCLGGVPLPVMLAFSLPTSAAPVEPEAGII